MKILLSIVIGIAFIVAVMELVAIIYLLLTYHGG